MSEIISDIDDNDVEVFVKFSHGMFVDHLYRIASPASWEQWATTQGYINEEGLRIRGVSITELGSVVITPGVYDPDGNETTPPVMDNKEHVNVRLSGDKLTEVDEATGLYVWEVRAIDFAKLGINGQSNKNERTQKLQSVEAIDPASINTPARIWAGDEQ